MARGNKLCEQAVLDVYRTTINKRHPSGNARETAEIISANGVSVSRPAVLYWLRRAGKRSGDARIKLPGRKFRRSPLPR
jgi:hypothetical protein